MVIFRHPKMILSINITILFAFWGVVDGATSPAAPAADKGRQKTLHMKGVVRTVFELKAAGVDQLVAQGVLVEAPGTALVAAARYRHHVVSVD